MNKQNTTGRSWFTTMLLAALAFPAMTEAKGKLFHSQNSSSN